MLAAVVSFALYLNAEWPHESAADLFAVTHAEAADAVWFNSCSQTWLRDTLAGRPDPDGYRALADMRRRYHVWEMVRTAKQYGYDCAVRREALAELRCLLGEEDFYAGWLPHPVPIQVFALIP